MMHTAALALCSALMLLAQASAQTATYINCGGASLVDSAGRNWQADTAFFSGDTDTYTTATGENTVISGVNDPLLYPVWNTERYDNKAAPVMGYAVPAAPGTYTVSLLFSENFYTSSNERIFDVLVQGQLVAFNLDIFAQAQASRTAYVLTHTVTTNGEPIAISFVREKRPPKINGIMVVEFQPTTTTTTTTTIGSNTVTRVSAGANAGFTDGSGNPWASDAAFVSGAFSSYTISSPADAAVAGADQAIWPLYNTGRRDEGSLSISIPLNEGLYIAKLYFIEPEASASVGDRVFDVALQDQFVLLDFDIVEAAGGAARTAVVREVIFSIPAGVSALDISFASTVGQAVIAGVEIQVYSINSGSSTGPPVVDTTADVVGETSTPPAQPTSVTTTTVATTSPITDEPTTTTTVTDAPTSTSTTTTVAPVEFQDIAEGETFLRLNAGGSPFVDSGSNVWEADTGYFFGGTSTFAADAFISNADSSLNDMYVSERAHEKDTPSMTYELPTPEAGVYRLRLHFAEIFFTNTGKRVFSIKVNGVFLETGFDIVARAGGPNLAVILETNVTVATPSNSGIVVLFTRQIQKPKVSGLELMLIENVATTTTTTPTTTSTTTTTTTTTSVRLQRPCSTTRLVVPDRPQSPLAPCRFSPPNRLG